MSSEQSGDVKGNTKIHTKPSVNAETIHVTPVVKSTRVKILDKSSPGNGSTWYYVQYGAQASEAGWVHGDRIAVLQEPTPVSSNKKYKLTVRTDTWFKPYPTDNVSQIPEEQRAIAYTGNTYNLSAYKLEASHYRFTLADTLIRNKNTWCVFQDHAQIAEIK